MTLEAIALFGCAALGIALGLNEAKNAPNETHSAYERERYDRSKRAKRGRSRR